MSEQTKITNIMQLREHALDTIQSLCSGNIDNQQALTTAKLYDSVVNTIKTEIEYIKLTDSKTKIDFMNTSIDVTPKPVAITHTAESTPKIEPKPSEAVVEKKEKSLMEKLRERGCEL